VTAYPGTPNPGTPEPGGVPTSTVAGTIVPDPRTPGPYRRLVVGPGEPHQWLARPVGAAQGRADPAEGSWAGAIPLVGFVQLTDLHVTDVQSTTRAEFLDRLGDPDSPLLPLLGVPGTYRPQERLTTQVLDAMVQAVAALRAGPVFGGPLAGVVLSGDLLDNAQANELAWLLGVLQGGVVRPDSGDPTRDEGVGGPDCRDERYWHPEPAPGVRDLPRERFGFPEVPGLPSAARAPFEARGLRLPWWALPGNHDVLLAGTVPPGPVLRAVAAGSWKPTGWRPGADLVQLLQGHDVAPPAVLRLLAGGPGRSVSPDPERQPWRPWAWPGPARGPFAFDLGPLRCVALDTVNRDGGWQGSLDRDQLAWLEAELLAGHARALDPAGRWVAVGGEPRPFALCTHHPLESLVNPYRKDPGATPRVLGEELLALLARFPNVLLWVAGHTHRHRVRFLPSPHGPFGCWAVTTSSLLDWPQQGRVLELALDPAAPRLLLASTVLDHGGLLDSRGGSLGDTRTLAGWSRELAVNAWHRPPDAPEPPGRGTRGDRNVVLPLPVGDPGLLEQLGAPAAAS
jgi:3',5'-cyclic AMP phosphodiesterase CpdA